MEKKSIDLRIIAEASFKVIYVINIDPKIGLFDYVYMYTNNARSFCVNLRMKK